MKNILCSIRTKTSKGKNKWALDKLEQGAMAGYQNSQGYAFDINAPELFTEKVIWYKVFFSRLGLVNIVDKYLFKDFVKSQLGSDQYTIPLYGAWDNIRDFKRSWAGLPEQFVLKSTLKSDSEFIIIVKDKNSINLLQLCKELKNG